MLVHCIWLQKKRLVFSKADMFISCLSLLSDLVQFMKHAWCRARQRDHAVMCPLGHATEADLTFAKKKKEKSMWTHTQMAFVLEGNRASRRLSVRPLQLRFPCRLYWPETPVLLFFSNILGKEQKYFSSLRMSDESEATGFSSGQRKKREVGLHAGRVISNDEMSDRKILYLF